MRLQTWSLQSQNELRRYEHKNMDDEKKEMTFQQFLLLLEFLPDGVSLEVTWGENAHGANE